MSSTQPDVFSSVKSSVTPEDLFNHYRVVYWRDGAVWRFTYPGCGDGSSAFCYENGRWEIGSKGVKGGSVIDLAMVFDPSLDEPIRAALYLADVFALDYEKKEGSKQLSERELVQRFYKNYIKATVTELWNPANTNVLAALFARGITEPTLRRLQVGYQPKGFKWDVLIPDGMAIEMKDTGLWLNRGEQTRPLFENRVTLPCITHGKVAGVIGYDWTKQMEKKYRYLNNQRCEWLHQSVFGLDTIKTDIPVAICEGAFDAMSILELSTPESPIAAIAIGGAGSKASLIQQHLPTIEKARSVFLCFDPDKAGREAFKSCSEILLSSVKDTFIAEFNMATVRKHSCNAGLNVRKESITNFAGFYGQTPKGMQTKLSQLRIRTGDGYVFDPYEAYRELGRTGTRPIVPIPYIEELEKQSKLDANEVLVTHGIEALRKSLQQPVHAITFMVQCINECSYGISDAKKLIMAFLQKYPQFLADEITSYLSAADLPMSKADVQDIVKRAAKDIAPAVVYARAITNHSKFIWIEGRGLRRYCAELGIWDSIHDNDAYRLLRKVVPINKQIADLWKVVLPEIIAGDACERSDMEAIRPYAERYINLANGTLDLKQKKLVPASPDHKCLHKLQFNWKTNPSCPKFKQFLRDISITPAQEGDPAEERRSELFVEYMMEVIGYWMIPDNRLQRMWMFYGKGSNGKGVLINVLRQLLGADNISYLDLDRLSDQFSLSTMEGKTVNIIPEFEGNRITGKHLAQLKNIIGGEPVMQEEKYGTPRPTVPTTKIIVFCNSPVQLAGSKHAAERRLFRTRFQLPVTFVYNMSEPCDDRRPVILNYADHLTSELDDIGSCALLALRNLLDRLADNEDLIDVYAATGEPDVIQDNIREFDTFLGEYLIKTEQNVNVEISEVLKRYREWCNSMKIAMNQVYPSNLNACRTELEEYCKTNNHGDIRKVSVAGRGAPKQMLHGYVLRSNDEENGGTKSWYDRT